MDVFARRSLLQGRPNPGGGADYVSGLQGTLTPKSPTGSLDVTIRYVPGKLVLAPESFEDYLHLLEELDWPTLEDLATAIVKDISNEMLTRWSQVNVKSAQSGLDHVATHEVTVEDQQPGWRNDDLIFRLPPI